MLHRMAPAYWLAAAISCLAPQALAQELKPDIIPIKRFDDFIFTKENHERLCAGGAQYVDKPELGKMLYAFPQRFLASAFESWLSSGNKYYEPEPPPPAETPTMQQFFDASPSNIYRLKCKRGGDNAKKDTDGTTETQLKKLTKNVVIRKQVSDLKISADQITKSNSALASYTRDSVAGSRTFSTEGLVGFVIAGTSDDEFGAVKASGRRMPTDLYWYSITPYIYQKRFDVMPDSKTKKDVNYFMPGIAANMAWVSADNNFGFDLQVDGSATIDEEQSSRNSSGALRVAPRIRLLEGVPKLGSAIGVGPFSIRPDLMFVARQFIVDEAGTNKDLKGIPTYMGLGFDGTVNVFWSADDSIFSNFVFKAAYIYRQNSNGAADITRRTAGISFTPFSEKNFSVELEYVKGRDENTLQMEDRWTAGIGIRY